MKCPVLEHHLKYNLKGKYGCILFFLNNWSSSAAQQIVLFQMNKEANLM